MSKEYRPKQVDAMSPSSLSATALKLARIEGQVRGIRQMVEADRPAEDKIHQENVATASLREVALQTSVRSLESRLDRLCDQAASIDDASSLHDFNHCLHDVVCASFHLPEPPIV